jgi:hypothetical protein
MKTAATSYRLGILLAVGTALVLLYGMGALGVIGSGGRADLMYLVVLGVGIIGTALARLRPRGMALALGATALGPVVVAAIALIAGLQDKEGASVADILALNAMFAAGFGLSAWLFLRAAGHTSQEGPVGRA